MKYIKTYENNTDETDRATKHNDVWFNKTTFPENNYKMPHLPIYEINQYVQLDLSLEDSPLDNVFIITELKWDNYYKEYYYKITNINHNFNDVIKETNLTKLLLRIVPEYEITATKYNI